MASDHVPLQAFRGFMYQEICQHLTPKDVEGLGYSQDLPVPYLTKSGPEVLMKLEMLDRFSAFDLSPLSKMMKGINRNDLAKKVDKFRKAQKRTTTKESSAEAQKGGKIEAILEITKLQTRILLEQIEELQSSARETGHRRLEDAVSQAVAIIEEQLQRQLIKVSSLLHQRQESVSSLDSSSPPSSLASSEDGLDCRSPESTMERGSRPCTDAFIKSMSLPRDYNKPLPPPPSEQEEDDSYEYITTANITLPPSAISGSLYYSSVEIASELRRDDKGQMVTGRDGASPRVKPPVAPKPKRTTMDPSELSRRSHTSDYTGGSADTSTGDSGFVDVQKFRKEHPPKVKPRHSYTPLKAEQREEACYYKTAHTQADTTQDVVYEDIHSYMNVSR